MVWFYRGLPIFSEHMLRFRSCPGMCLNKYSPDMKPIYSQMKVVNQPISINCSNAFTSLKLWLYQIIYEVCNEWDFSSAGLICSQRMDIVLVHCCDGLGESYLFVINVMTSKNKCIKLYRLETVAYSLNNLQHWLGKDWDKWNDVSDRRFANSFWDTNLRNVQNIF